jgi:hypothetical protein
MSGKNEKMKAGDLIPVTKEFSFIFKIAAIMAASVAAALAILYFFLDKDVSGSYGAAFRLLAETHDRLNVYITAAVLVQLVISSVVVYFVALYFSHKIAGPIFRLKVVLQQYMDGEEIEKVSFRKTDFIPGVSRIFTNFFLYLGNRKKLLNEAQMLVDRLDRQTVPETQKTIERLRAIVIELEG